jgi:hypothetical protein
VSLALSRDRPLEQDLYRGKRHDIVPAYFAVAAKMMNVSSSIRCLIVDYSLGCLCSQWRGFCEDSFGVYVHGELY